MILVFSNFNDHSTTEVISYLVKFNYKYLRVNSEVPISINWVSLEDFSFNYEGDEYLCSNFKCFWYRRGNFNVPYRLLSDDLVPKEIQENILVKEQRILIQFLHRLVENRCKGINSFFNSEMLST